MTRSIYGDDVGATLVTPLYARAHAHLVRGTARFDDQQAQQVWTGLERLAAQTGATSPRELAVTEHTNVLGTVRRSVVMDQAVVKFALGQLDTRVITLGLGLCNRRSRLAHLSASFVGVDREQVIELRRRLIPDDPTTLIAGCATEPAWLDPLVSSPATLIVAEGLLMYLNPADVTDLLQRLAVHFGPGTRLLGDIFHPTVAQLGHPINQRTGARFHSGHLGADGLAGCAPGWRPVANTDIMGSSGFLPAQWNAAFQLFSGRSMYTVAEIEYAG